MIKRIFDPMKIQKTYFLLGPRQTGKSTLLHEEVPPERYFDLLEPTLFRELSSRPEALIEMLRSGNQDLSRTTIVIDEIQKCPHLLDTIQLILQKHPGMRFILTGSSARQLRKAGQNMLGGRARRFSFHPLTLFELSKFEKDPLPHALRFGGLPGVRMSTDPGRELLDYVGVYLQEEIMAESMVRNVNFFARFLTVAGLCNAEQINYEKVGSDAQVPGRTVKDYFDILEDTLIGHRLEPYRPQKSRKFVSAPKFYVFDVGVAHFIHRKSVESLSQIDLGKALEHLIFCELRAFLSYRESLAELFFWRTQAGSEVDFVIRDPSGQLIGIEVKLTDHPNDRDLAGLRAFAKDNSVRRKILVCQTPRSRKTTDDCEILPVLKFVEKLWQGTLFD